MPEANFLFEQVFIIALDAPAHLGEIDKAAEQHGRHSWPIRATF
jgi:hypothetical protein